MHNPTSQARTVANGGPSGSNAGEMFQCYNCGRRFRWKPDISGRTLRCKCGSKVRCPELHDETVTAEESLEDTVAEVEIEEIFDHADVAEASELEQVQEAFRAYRPHRGAFGLSLGGEVIFYGVLSMIGLACAILAVIVGKYFWWYIVAAVLIGPFSWIRFAKRWKKWARGRSWLQVLSDLLERDEDETKQTA